MKCDSRATESDFDAAFVTQPATLGRPARRFCPACWIKQRHFQQAWFLPSVLVGGICGFLIDRSAPELLLGRFVMTVCFAGLFLVLTILPHELGHVITARALGWYVYQVVIGVGNPLFKWRWFACDRRYSRDSSRGHGEV